ncbi:Pre-rRNA-processing protein ipi1 [Xylona heveae TC161]|uniref:Pre-rRNA-processing protein n=1 Tax=Xylona heveae (strain CBS 132557 / TC161) TaxID=1328760 RepID=A0A165FED3_XYLHT|nr:Pre-rRNA-processing protein ipi1 [Xylona heveae TC161]KZF20884.1 Pre-rRNA-processing protein ipi1 [Xylona heveae TC161]
MGSSAKKKKEKKQDFQKAKLKVGKTKPKASNFTDTSFSSKAIVVNQQSLAANAPTQAALFNHHLSLLTHRSDTQRRESLSFLTTALSTRPVHTPPPQPFGVILPKLFPLVLDGSGGVRQQLLKLVKCLSGDEVDDHVDEILLYIRAGMTHLAPDIRSSSLDLLEWLLDVSGLEVVSCAGGWVKTLQCFLALLGWRVETGTASKWTSTSTSLAGTAKPTFGKAGSDGKYLVKKLHALALFLRTGLLPPTEDGLIGKQDIITFPLWQTEQHLLPKRSACFAHLNLFGAPRDEESEMYEDREDRQGIFAEKFQPTIERGLDNARKEGGEVGRAAASVRKAVSEGMEGYSREF